MSLAESRGPADRREPRAGRAESEATYSAFALGVVGGVYGLILGLIDPGELLADGATSFALWAAVGSGAAAAVAACIGYWRSTALAGREWRRTLAPWKLAANTLSVIVVHTVLAFIETYVIYRLVGLGFIGLPVGLLWSVVMMAVTVGLTAQLVYLSVSKMDTQRMSSLLRTFIAFGIITAMVVAPEPDWWRVHFSHLGTFHGELAGIFFNGTLIAAGLLVTTFAVYIAHDMNALAAAGVLTARHSPRLVSTLFVVMGAAFAGVGLVAVDINRVVHDIAALALAAVFLGMLIGGPWILRGMPRTYFVWSWAILATVAGAALAYAVGSFTLTGVEIIVFVLIFGWISLFIRFLGVAGQRARQTEKPPSLVIS